MSNVNTDELVDAYISLRTERAKLKEEYDEKDAALQKDMQALEAALLDVCNTVNANSIRTKNGTVMRRVNERFYCTDWDNFKQFILENGAVDLFEKRIHQGNFKEFMSEREGDGLPPGVNVMREYGVTVRKSSAE
jgi:hypothetical protein